MSPMTVIAQNNIQRYFLGLNFMDHYGNAYTTLTKISAKYSNQSIPSLDNNILYDLHFGGVIWNHTILTFDVIKSESSSRSYFYAIDVSLQNTYFNPNCHNYRKMKIGNRIHSTADFP